MSFLDLDYYKLTMLQFIWKHYAEVPVTFSLHSRKQGLRDLIDDEWLWGTIDAFHYAELEPHEHRWMVSKGFDVDFVRALRNIELANPVVTEDSVTVSGSWFNTTLWETVILGDVSEWYSHDKVRPPSSFQTVRDVLTIGQSGAKWADFGTRRRYSRWAHRQMIRDLAAEAPNATGFIGTSNVEFAMENGVPAIGTYAHELEMVVRTGHISQFSTTRDVLTKWQDMYPREQRIALTDTYTTPAFLEDHGEFLLENDWRGVRLDSGDPFEIGTMVHQWLKARGARWDVVFSDGLDARTIVELQWYFTDTNINPLFGWGTGFTNPNSDLSLVMKATEARGQKTYKITDDKSKSIR